MAVIVLLGRKLRLTDQEFVSQATPAAHHTDLGGCRIVPTADHARELDADLWWGTLDPQRGHDVHTVVRAHHVGDVKLHRDDRLDDGFNRPGRFYCVIGGIITHRHSLAPDPDSITDLQSESRPGPIDHRRGTTETDLPDRQ